MALEDLQTLWTDRLKPYIANTYATKQEVLKASDTITSTGGQQYTVGQLLAAMAELMGYKITADPITNANT